MAETQQQQEEMVVANMPNGLPNNGSAQLVEETDTGQAPVGPDPTQNQGIPTEHRYVFYVHVKPGETFTIRQGDQVQTITGPASVPIYSNTPTPPIIPVQGGQYVQQVIQDSDGTHRIIFTPPGPGGQLPPHMAPQMYPHPGGGMYPHMMPPSGGGMPPHMYPQMVGPGDGSGVPPHLHPHMYAYPHQPAPPQCNSPELNHNSVYGHEPQQRPPIHRSRPRDDRTDRQRERLQRKLRDRQKENLNMPMNYNHIPHKSPSTSPLTTENGMSRSNGRSKRYNGVENDIGDDPEVKRKRECLSSIQPPVTSNIQTRSVTVRWSPPFLENSDEESGQEEQIDPLPLVYDLILNEKGRDNKWRPIYSGSEMEFVIADLKPATEYQLSVCAIWEDIRGSPSKSVTFRTLNCAPAIPAPPKLAMRSKNSISVKWNAPCDNGSRILSYTLQCDMGEKNSNFVEVYKGAQKQYRITKLQPSMPYAFRLAATNEIGNSEFSPTASYYTSGSAPQPPTPPEIVRAAVHSITLKWEKASDDITSFTLEMDDETNRYGFQAVYCGDEISYTCNSLARKTLYKFRLCAINDQGSSPWSEAVMFCTVADKPGAPSKPTLKGKVHSNHFKVTWEWPKDDGGTEITTYLLEINDGHNGPFELVYKGADTEFICDNLQPGCTYKLRVCCVSEGGQSRYSDISQITTLPVSPGPCHPPRLNGKPKASSLNIRWAPPEYNGGSAVSEYLLEMDSVDDNSTKEVYRGIDTDCIVNPLLPGRKYAFRVRAFNRAGGSPFSDYFYVTTGAGPPDAPLEPCCTCKSPHIVIITWHTPCGNGAEITEYRLEWATTEGTFTHHYIGPLLSHEVKALLPATYYYFRVQAVNSSGPGQFSAVATCLTSPSSPGAVTHLELLANTANTLHVQWKEPNNYGSQITSYNVDIGDKQPLIVSDNITEKVIEGLVPDSKYRIRVQAVNSIGVGHYSSPLKICTLPLPPNAPRLECVLNGHQSLKLKWGENSKSIDAKLLNYTLQMEDRKGRFNVVYSGSSLNHKISKLSELTTYKFRIFASNDAGNGPLSEIFSFTTGKAPPPAPKAPKVKNITEDSCELIWQSIEPMQGDPILYYLQYQRTKDREYKQAYRGAGTTTRLDVLHPNVEYRVRVCAIRQSHDGLGDLVGAYSPGTVFHTQSDEPIREAVEAEVKIVKVERKPLTDEQWAAIIVVGFAICAILIALLVAQFMA